MTLTMTTKEAERKATVCSVVCFSVSQSFAIFVFCIKNVCCKFPQLSVTTTTIEGNRADAKPNLGSVDSLSARCSSALQTVNFH